MESGAPGTTTRCTSLSGSAFPAPASIIEGRGVLEHLANVRRQPSNGPGPSQDLENAWNDFQDTRNAARTGITVISVGAIVGIIIGAVAFIALIVAICLLCKRRRRVARGAGSAANEFRYGAGWGGGHKEGHPYPHHHYGGHPNPVVNNVNPAAHTTVPAASYGAAHI
ncbi:hypothetical protein GGTG_13109 [Gaeumannomyces tritici R3-111a-1]|uniref:Uncharacterized protein n=1 Tax=Gaeumannomyces tritici (strain R3-111a-1) TaxID=644352 RepID=J3PHX8_GAET3|nr:hypothetical protein GGTG_13109 [Gaeumannomyces tritici R3-111a-1]EJT69490.1 hypothetical protein GGTG_13109 [Gaeumannomyces tritici R3-111a-1]